MVLDAKCTPYVLALNSSHLLDRYLVNLKYAKKMSFQKKNSFLLKMYFLYNNYLFGFWLPFGYLLLPFANLLLFV